MQLRTFVFLSLLFAFVSCGKNTELEVALDLAGANRTELEKVLTHYSKNPADSLKLRAAEFLISNMVYHHTYTNKNLAAYYKDLIKLNNDTLKAINSHNIYDSLGVKYRINEKDLKIKYDIQTIKADYLIKNIDHAINNWYSNPWTQHLSFADFCEYVLPYRVGNENLEEWRKVLATKYLKKIEWINTVDDARNSPYWATRYLTDSFRKRGYHIYSYTKPAPLNHLPMVVENIKIGPCDDYAQSTVFILRAMGIPVCIDFTPQWPNRSMGHSWNVLFDESGKEIPFMGGETAPGYPNRPGDVMAKVFRKTYSYQSESLFHIKQSEKIPTLFDTPYLKDVTQSYYTTVDISVQLNIKTKNNFAYLAVFDNANWTPIHWGKITSANMVEFQNMGKNCMYLPMIYNDGQQVPAGLPFLINEKGKRISIESNFKSRTIMKLNRKYPVKRNIYLPSRKIMGLKIEASANANFKDSVVVGTIIRDPIFIWDTLHCNTKNKYRFWRLIANNKSVSSLAEFQFMFQNQNITDTTKLLSKLSNTTKKANIIFDNDKLTYIQLKQNPNEWIGIDFGKPVSVDYFRFLPRNDDNATVAGDSYELMMWGGTGWISLVKCVAKSDCLQFKNVPSGGLYLLHNHTKGNEERIFTYENGKQVWW